MPGAQRMLADRNGKGGRQSKFCLRVEMAQKQSIWHYQPVKSCTFLRVIVATPNLVTQARGASVLWFWWSQGRPHIVHHCEHVLFLPAARPGDAKDRDQHRP